MRVPLGLGNVQKVLIKRCFFLNFRTSYKRPVSTSAARMAGQRSIGDEVLLSHEGAAGVIILNRPKALNSLTLNMIRKIYPVLQVCREFLIS